MADKLKIYACTGVNGQKQKVDATALKKLSKVTFDTFGSNTLTNTQAENSLLTRINCARAELKLQGLTKEERTELYNSIDFYTACLEAVRKYKGNKAELEKSGIALGNMLSSGSFTKIKHQRTAKRRENLDDIKDTISAQVFEMTGEADENANKEFTRWWEKNITARNTTFAGGVLIAQKLDNALENTFKAEYQKNYLDWRNDTDLSELLTQCAKYFIYLYFTDDELAKLPAVFRQKREKQLEIYWFVCDKFLGVYGDQEDIDRILYTGIIEETGKTPRQICQEVVSGVRDPESIGELTMAIATLIVAAISAIVAIIKAIIDAVARSNEAKYKMMQDAEDGAASEDDFNGLTISNKEKTKRTLLGVAAGLIGIMVILKNSK